MTRERTLTYKVWHAMKARCVNPKYSSYQNYGARGIKVCDRWQEFDAFVADMGFQPPGLHIDRINNDGNYEPGNCRWVTPSENNKNRRDTRMVTARGKTQCMADWAVECGISLQCLWARIDKGWDVEEALSMPVLRRSSVKARLAA